MDIVSTRWHVTVIYAETCSFEKCSVKSLVQEGRNNSLNAFYAACCTVSVISSVAFWLLCYSWVYTAFT